MVAFGPWFLRFDLGPSEASGFGRDSTLDLRRSTAESSEIECRTSSVECRIVPKSRTTDPPSPEPKGHQASAVIRHSTFDVRLLSPPRLNVERRVSSVESPPK